MDDIRKNSIINRLSTGMVYLRHKGKIYKLVPPSRDTRALSEMIYQETLYNFKYNNMLSREKALTHLKARGMWSDSDDQKIEEINKVIENQKIYMYKNNFKIKECASARKIILGLEAELQKKYTIRYLFDDITIEGLAEYTRNMYIIGLSIYNDTDKRVFSIDSINNELELINLFLAYLSKEFITTQEYREIARTEPFRSLWSISKHNVFGAAPVDLTSDQKNLVMYCRMYDNVYEHPERPSEKVIDDDYMLDGWFAEKRRESEKELKKKQTDSMVKKSANNAGEFGFVVSSREEADDILKHNDIDSRMKIKSRIEATKKYGSLEEKDLPDMKLELRNKAMREASEKIKGKK